MSARQTIDSLQFAKSGGRLSGEIRAEKFHEELPRLADVLSSESPPVQYQLMGEIHSGRPTLHLSVSVQVTLVCQRCLEDFVEVLDLDRVYPIARNEAELVRWERDEPLLEALVAESRLVVTELVEEEILLSLPTVPHHDEGECNPMARASIH